MTERAFPQGNDRVVHALAIANSQGMTLRDYFAAKALPPMMHADAGRWEGNYEIHAERAYKYADAMMKARGQK
jgi:hypothetical protein